MINKKNVIILIILLLFLGMIYAPPKKIAMKVYAGSLSPMNTDPLGTSNYVELLKKIGYEVELGGPENLTTYGRGDVYILLGPDRELTQSEIVTIRQFLDRGGSILIADEFGIVNNLLREMFDAEINKDYVRTFYYTFAQQANASPPIQSNMPIQIALIPYLGESIFFRSIGNATEDYSKELFVELYINSVINPEESKLHVMYPSLSSYIGEPGTLTPDGYIMTYDHELLREGEISGAQFHPLLSINLTSIYIYSSRFDGGRYRAYVVADTSIFTNQYINLDNPKSTYITYHKQLILWLSRFKIGKILIDNTHYELATIEQPLPSLGKLIVSMLTETSKDILEGYNSFLSSTTPILLLLLVSFTIPSTYIYLRRRIMVRDIQEREPSRVTEKLLVYKSRVMEEIGRGRFISERHRDVIIGLYDLLDYILSNNLGAGISDIALGNIDRSLIAEHGLEPDMVLKHCRRLERIRRKVIDNTFLPIVISWGRVIRRLVRDTDHILSRLGYGFISNDVERGIEDVFR